MLRKIAEIKVPKGAGPREAKTNPIFATYDRQGAAFAFYFSDSNIAGAAANLLFMVDGQKVFVDDGVTLGETNETHTFTYPLPDKLLNYTGKVDGYLYFDFEDGSHSDEIHFVFTIKKSQIDEEMEEAPDIYIKSFEDVKERVEQAGDSATKDIEKAKDDAKSQIGDYVGEVESAKDSAVEDIDKALPEDLLDEAKNYTDDKVEEFNETITKQLAQTAKINAQVDFVDFVQKNRIPYDRMRLVKRDNDAYQIWLSNQEKGIIYDFAKDSNDDFIKLNAGYSGLDKQGSQFVDKDNASDGNLSGSWTASGRNRYTTTVGDSFTLKSEGEKLVLTINSESRGGLWSIKIDGGEPVEVSCYSSSVLVKDVVLAEELENVKHTVVGTFMGDDPKNPPSSTPSRGYLKVSNLTEKGTLTGYVGDVSNTAENTLMGTSSNKEFAFTATKDGYHNWVPEHGAKGSAFQIAPPEFYIDGHPVDVENMVIGSGSAKEISHSFEMKQYFYGHVVGYGSVMKVWTSHKIGSDGKLIFKGKMEAVDTFELVGYPMMLPAQDEFMNEFVTGIYNSKTNDKSETYSYFSEEKDMVNSGAIISSSNKNLILAGTLLNPIKTYRLGEVGKPPLDESLFLWNRSSKPKMYWMSMQANNFVIGDTYQWGFEMAMAEIDNVYDMIKY